MTGVILCGGSGTRLWPLSRDAYPKQFVDLVDGESLFEKTVNRNRVLCESLVVVTNKRHVFIAADQLSGSQGIKPSDAMFILEPVGRNTAPAIALACMAVDQDETVLVVPSDHLIADADAYAARCAEAQKLADKGYLVTFGIKPEYPETGYGYIEADLSKNLGSENAFGVASFREKPDVETAKKFVAAGSFLWNSGMFMFKAGQFLNELKQLEPAMYEACVAAWEKAAKRKDDSLGYDMAEPRLEDMASIPANSIDYAVMEKSRQVACVRSSLGWNDLGSFDSLYGVRPKDASGNTLDDNLVQHGSKGSLIQSSGRVVALVGMEDCIVIDSEDSLLVAKRGEAQNVKKIVDALKASGGKRAGLTEYHGTVHRPWGSYTLLDEGDNFKIKRIVVKPGRKLSLQKHLHRSEHWVVVSGTATVTVDSEQRIVRTNESVYIPIAGVHRLENEGKVDLAIIETQVGQYLGEDDIIRLDDVYGRA